jgi:acetyl-CoA acyltransferase
VPVETEDGLFAVDEGVRRGTTPDKLAKLKPSFREDGVIHAGNASQISDGASAVLITTSEKAAELGLTPIARIVAGSVVGDDPVMMLTGPIPATQKLLARTGLSIDDIGAVEVNEAFAPVPLAWQIELGAKPDRLNPLGGAIALGHPLGATGGFLAIKLINHMRDKGIRYGLQAICEGGGTANATLYELIE